MSVDINWDSLTTGPDGAALAETIRQFVHERFQSIPLPHLIRSVAVHGFEFGQRAPEITLKDIGDPLSDFYESDEEQDDDDDDGDESSDGRRRRVAVAHGGGSPRRARSADDGRGGRWEERDRAQTPRLPPPPPPPPRPAPGVLGASSNLGYFHLPLSAGLPGTATPLAAVVAGAQYQSGRARSRGRKHRADSFGSVAPSSPATPPSSREHAYFAPPSGSAAVADDGARPPSPHMPHRHPERNPDDVQVVFHARYAGDIKLSLTVDVFLDYPMPSFVGIPVKLNITGLTFAGVGILAYIKKRAHLCFLGPDDAEALVGGETPPLHGARGQLDECGHGVGAGQGGTLLEDIQIESEIGQTESGKQVLKNVGKVEKFILEQVRRLFDDEFVYPSFWTFLV